MLLLHTTRSCKSRSPSWNYRERTSCGSESELQGEHECIASVPQVYRKCTPRGYNLVRAARDTGNQTAPGALLQGGWPATRFANVQRHSAPAAPATCSSPCDSPPPVWPNTLTPAHQGAHTYVGAVSRRRSSRSCQFAITAASGWLSDGSIRPASWSLLHCFATVEAGGRS
eukprot:356655-Chlamydomonas_euryale.AAC.8